MGNKELYNTLNRYFKRLSQVGYIPDNETFSVLVLDYVTELKLSKELTVEETAIVDRALTCLRGSCLFPYGYCKGTCN